MAINMYQTKQNHHWSTTRPGSFSTCTLEKPALNFGMGYNSSSVPTSEDIISSLPANESYMKAVCIKYLRTHVIGLQTTKSSPILPREIEPTSSNAPSFGKNSSSIDSQRSSQDSDCATTISELSTEEAIDDFDPLSEPELVMVNNWMIYPLDTKVVPAEPSRMLFWERLPAPALAESWSWLVGFCDEIFCL